jgi:hypothetical protein
MMITVRISERKLRIVEFCAANLAAATLEILAHIHIAFSKAKHNCPENIFFSFFSRPLPGLSIFPPSSRIR